MLNHFTLIIKGILLDGFEDEKAQKNKHFSNYEFNIKYKLKKNE
jgi:hypothetical protein